MGVCHIVANHTAKEYVDARDLDFGAKEFEWCANEVAGVVMCLLCHRWQNGHILVVPDTCGEVYWRVRDDYENISFEAAADFNELCGRDLPESHEEVVQRRKDRNEAHLIRIGEDPREDTD